MEETECISPWCECDDVQTLNKSAIIGIQL